MPASANGRNGERLRELIDRVRAEDADRAALLDQIAAGLTADPTAAHLLRKARNLIASPHFDEALAAFVSAVQPDADQGDPPPAEPLQDATRDELYEMAKEADIPGRSAMNKQELADALRDQD